MTRVTMPFGSDYLVAFVLVNLEWDQPSPAEAMRRLLTAFGPRRLA